MDVGIGGGRMIAVLKIIGVVIVVALAGVGGYVLWNLKDWGHYKG